MSSVAHHLVRRAVELTNINSGNPTEVDDGPDNDRIKKLATWGIVLLWVTSILYGAAVAAINYTYGNVVATLTMIETPTATAFAAVPAEEPVEVDAALLSEEEVSEKQKLKALEQDLFLVKQQPITAKLRTTIRHLRAVGGRLARFRGFQVALVYHIAHGFIVHLAAGNHRFSPIRPLASIIATVALFRMDLLWTHIVMSNPSSKPWYRRFVKLNSVKSILLTTAACAIAQEVAAYIPAMFAHATMIQFAQSQWASTNPSLDQRVAIAQMGGVVLMALVAVFMVIIPAQVTLTRVQASLLDDEDETIVPFDRSFGGRKAPEVVNGKSCIGMKDAWRSFDKAGRWRLIKLYLKVVAIQVTASLFFILTIAGELKLIMGADFEKSLRIIQAALKRNE